MYSTLTLFRYLSMGLMHSLLISQGRPVPTPARADASTPGTLQPPQSAAALELAFRHRVRTAAFGAVVRWPNGWPLSARNGPSNEARGTRKLTDDAAQASGAMAGTDRTSSARERVGLRVWYCRACRWHLYAWHLFRDESEGCIQRVCRPPRGGLHAMALCAHDGGRFGHGRRWTSDACTGETQVKIGAMTAEGRKLPLG